MQVPSTCVRGCTEEDISVNSPAVRELQRGGAQWLTGHSRELNPQAPGSLGNPVEME